MCTHGLVKLLAQVQQALLFGERSTDDGERTGELVANGEGKGERDGRGFLHMPAAAGLLKQEARTAIKIDIAAAVAGVEFVE